MPPKSLSVTKTASLLSFFLDSLTVHTLKDLEKSVPGPTGISSMQLKDYLQALVDDSQLRVEKIGSGNWYWAFASDAVNARETTLEALRTEHSKLETLARGLQENVELRNGEEAKEAEKGQLKRRWEGVKGEVESLKRELEGFEGMDPAAAKEMKQDAMEEKIRAEKWTDNVLLVEAYFMELTGGNKEALEAVRKELYGGEYIEGEGLVEL